MNTEDKIVALLEQLNTRMENLESGQAALEGRLERMNGDQKLTNLELRNLGNKQAAFEGRMGRFEESLAAMQAVQTQLVDDVAGLKDGVTGLKDDVAGLKDDVTGIKLRFELDVDKRFNAVDEGIDAILEQLIPKRQVEEMEADIAVLKSAVKMLSQEVAALKRAQ